MTAGIYMREFGESFIADLGVDVTIEWLPAASLISGGPGGFTIRPTPTDVVVKASPLLPVTARQVQGDITINDSYVYISGKALDDVGVVLREGLYVRFADGSRRMVKGGFQRYDDSSNQSALYQVFLRGE